MVPFMPTLSALPTSVVPINALQHFFLLARAGEVLNVAKAAKRTAENRPNGPPEGPAWNDSWLPAWTRPPSKRTLSDAHFIVAQAYVRCPTHPYWLRWSTVTPILPILDSPSPIVWARRLLSVPQAPFNGAIAATAVVGWNRRELEVRAAPGAALADRGGSGGSAVGARVPAAPAGAVGGAGAGGWGPDSATAAADGADARAGVEATGGAVDAPFPSVLARVAARLLPECAYNDSLAAIEAAVDGDANISRDMSDFRQLVVDDGALAPFPVDVARLRGALPGVFVDEVNTALGALELYKGAALFAFEFNEGENFVSLWPSSSSSSSLSPDLWRCHCNSEMLEVLRAFLLAPQEADTTAGAKRKRGKPERAAVAGGAGSSEGAAPGGAEAVFPFKVGDTVTFGSDSRPGVTQTSKIIEVHAKSRSATIAKKQQNAEKTNYVIYYNASQEKWMYYYGNKSPDAKKRKRRTLDKDEEEEGGPE